jgi:NAD(P)-dependent dehydrogenase (short-subunit alcohol dehydrogenase family)
LFTSIAGRGVVVTGATRGIGKGIARLSSTVDGGQVLPESLAAVDQG